MNGKDVELGSCGLL